MINGVIDFCIGNLFYSELERAHVFQYNKKEVNNWKNITICLQTSLKGICHRSKYFQFTIYPHNRFTVTPLKSNCSTAEKRALEMKMFSNKPTIRVSLKFC